MILSTVSAPVGALTGTGRVSNCQTVGAQVLGLDMTQFLSNGVPKPLGADVQRMFLWLAEGTLPLVAGSWGDNMYVAPLSLRVMVLFLLRPPGCPLLWGLNSFP